MVTGDCAKTSNYLIKVGEKFLIVRMCPREDYGMKGKPVWATSEGALVCDYDAVEFSVPLWVVENHLDDFWSPAEESKRESDSSRESLGTKSNDSIIDCRTNAQAVEILVNYKNAVGSEYPVDWNSKAHKKLKQLAVSEDLFKLHE